MTDTVTTFAVGDCVQVVSPQSPFHGCTFFVTGIHSTGQVEVDDLGFEPYELDLIHGDVDDEAVPSSVAGTSTVGAESTGATAESATEEPPVPTIEDLAAQVAALTRQVDHLGTIAQHQISVNSELTSCLAILGISPSPFAGEPPYAFPTGRPLVDGTFRHLEGAPRTTNRVHTKIVKNTKGYGFELSAEVSSDDPTVNVTNLVSDLLDQADLDTREHIKHAEYRDQYGLPGDDEVTTF